MYAFCYQFLQESIQIQIPPNILYFLSTNNETIRSHYYLCDAVTPPRSLQPGEQADCAHQRLMCSTTFLWVLVW